MNHIKRHAIGQLGYNFVPKEFLPKGKDEYYLRYQQNPATDYRALTKNEITILESNSNKSDNWENVLVREGIDIHLIEDCSFYGLVRIGKLEPYFLEFSEFRTAVGLYRSRIVSCDIGNNVSISNAKFLSHYIIDDEVIMTNIYEMSTTSHSKFGNGIIKKGEKEEVRIWLEICNENGGRKVLPFDGMLAADAWMWSKFRNDEVLMKAFQQFTEKKFDSKRGYYGMVGKRTVIKNSQIIKDVNIGSDAYIKGANKLKNLTINSSENAQSQIGEGCEMVNGIMGYGSRSFYGVKAVRFILGSFSQLKYGARLINSYLGENATISCCEVLNSLIFPAHEQHHNNSFLCAAVLMGQTNMAAGATIGSNHNSRGADGEMVAGRGFWPGLCVSLKHNSKFASFVILAKGDYPAELNIPIPFSLVSNEEHRDRLVVMPAYWLMYNMYAILRNEIKFGLRDKRIEKIQKLEYSFLAPDTVNEIFNALKLLQQFTGKAFFEKYKMVGSDEDYTDKGKSLLEHESPLVPKLEIFATGFENAKRPVEIIKVQEAYNTFKKMLVYYATSLIIHFIKANRITTIEELKQQLPHETRRLQWLNLGGQLISKDEMAEFIENIKSQKVKSWEEVHHFYRQQSETYEIKKLAHGVISLLEILDLKFRDFDQPMLLDLLYQAIETKDWITKSIYNSRAKDYKNPFRNMVYDTKKEMETVLGKLDDNSFINEQREEQKLFKKEVEEIIASFS